ncbi:tannase/feruloyl esterase family alpha/beta hydrolase [Burkholderia multivorans]|uniref:tannase/feruloyl esterase family alpha/beta hydrolase n=1 Tax=Burkholderia multivorans TaxID=87883 RepID=UPI0020189C21|nr:tannase/feruloyl esterase family alpha/beta hydrolase [Burkholderia multivorans]MCO1367043.1 tannase/feruloyl esterase family alpha/beta hydrolase [Burkholderia multivorans]MCO1376652.1 tannase/feruloyl esterase family alpha/beta hydrolase [Burkholderia multivorans]UQP18604.1 tannase/feruloyl esterase family alpha/beta hydrolase [Burkholderia multivorans]UQP86573.1 tannase/feruloyl esterase family alpha/beta hydrolase [Burkholderia multivorans]
MSNPHSIYRYAIVGKLMIAAPFASFVLSMSGCGGSASSSSTDTAQQVFQQSCAGLKGKAVAEGTIVSAVDTPASGVVPEMCTAMGTIVSSSASTINFKVEMPIASAWNRKMLQEGGGGYNGVIVDYLSTYETGNVRQRGYVVVADDSGHQSKSVADLSFALDNGIGFDNFAELAVPRTYAAAQAAIKLMYGVAPTYNYFYGMSTGGREALQQAQRNPQNYAGIVADVPVIDYDQVIQKGIGVQQQALNSNGAGWLDANKIKLYENAELAACDALDGVADGIISNVAACHFDPKTLRCPGGSEAGDTCLSDAQLATVNLLTTDSTLPVSLANNVTIAPRWGMGAESDSGGGWAVEQLGATNQAIASALGVFSDQWIKYAIKNDPNTNLLTYSPTQDAAKWQSVSAQVNATNPDMSAFAAQGGKLILYSSLSDQLVEPFGTIAYFNRVVQTMGQSRTDGFMRYYTAPGVTHSGTGPGAGLADRLGALENWVEKGVAPPDQLLATRLAADGTVALTRPMCRYPAWPKYNGGGDVNSASSFTCVNQ